MSCAHPSTWLSAARFAPFLNAAEGDHSHALELYDRHAEMAAASFQLIHYFEVIVRNAIDGVLGEGQPQEPLTDTWLLDFETLQAAGIKQVIVAIERLGRGKAITRGRVIAGVPFGFWTGLFDRRYEELWRQRLRHAFAHGSPTRAELAESLGRIRRFRNRVAHHDCLLSQDVGSLVEEMLRIVGWIDPQARAWLEGRARVAALLDRWPRSGYACSATGTSSALGAFSR